jgi:TolB-like protein
MTNGAGTTWLHRLRERGVLRVAVSYAVIAWLLLQIADVTFEPLGVPRWVMVSLIVTAVLGLPVAVALAWFYETGDRGISLDTAAEGVPRPVVHGLRRYADIAIIGVLLVAVAVLLVRQSELGSSGAGTAAIAVLPFQNLSTAADGKVLALGIAESVLHQLANLQKLEVISRTSSFALGNRQQDAREIGRQLGARYLLEGSVQSHRTRMRVTTQLIDTQTGADVWSMRFDRPPGDIFEVQDEIALQVTRALELSLDAKERDRLTGQGTENLDAYLAFLQGRSLQANDRVADTRDAIGHFERATRLDPEFANAYVSLADAKLFVAEYEVTDDRAERFEAALREGRELVQRALAIDPENGDAYLQRAHLAAYDDLSAAEADFRKGLDLSPNSAEGYAGLATVLYEDPARRDEALQLLERARRIDPLEPGYDVKKAVFLMYERSDISGADKLLSSVLERHPRYVPALLRQCEIRSMQQGRQADGIRLCEQALAGDPLVEQARRVLIRTYLDIEDPIAAEQLADTSRGDEAVTRAFMALYRRDWTAAGEAAYEALERGTASPDNAGSMYAAIRLYARTTGDAARAIAAIEPHARVEWDGNGKPTLRESSAESRHGAIALADLLILDGQIERGRRLLAEIIGTMERETRVEGRPELWYLPGYAMALGLNGETDAAIVILERSYASGQATSGWWLHLEAEPAYDALRKIPRFEVLRRKVREHIAEERQKVTRMRKEGLLPHRNDDES